MYSFCVVMMESYSWRVFSRTFSFPCIIVPGPSGVERAKCALIVAAFVLLFEIARPRRSALNRLLRLPAYQTLCHTCKSFATLKNVFCAMIKCVACRWRQTRGREKMSANSTICILNEKLKRFHRKTRRQEMWFFSFSSFCFAFVSGLPFSGPF